jgi:hypothetical protein
MNAPAPRFKKILTLKNKKKPPESPNKTISATSVVRVAITRKTPPAPAVEVPKPIPVKKSKAAKPQKKKAVPPTKPKPPLTPDIPRFVKVAATLTMLRQEFPLVFTEADIHPFAVGIRQDIHKLLKKRALAEGLTKKSVVSKSLIGEAVDLWKQIHPEYGQALLIAGTPRIGIDGTVQGEVTEAHVQLMLNPPIND